MVIHLGDLSAGVKGRHDELFEMVNSLNGNRILIRGNHDHYKMSDYINKMNFESVYDYLILDDILFTHYPLEINKWMKDSEIKNINFLNDLYIKNNLKYVVHGHTHNRNIDLDNHYNCSVEQINYTPILLEKLIKNKEK